MAVRDPAARNLVIRPRDARRRAAVINKVTRSPDTPGRPLLWCLAAGSIAVVVFGLIILGLVQQYPGGDLRPVLLLFAPVCAASTWAFCYGWEIFDSGKATRLWLVLVFGAVAIVIVVALVLLAMAASKSDADLDLDIDLGGVVGDVGRAVGDVGTDVLADLHGGGRWSGTEPVIDEAGSGAAGPASTGGSSTVVPIPPDDPSGTECVACGFRFDAARIIACPNCGRPV